MRIALARLVVVVAIGSASVLEAQTPQPVPQASTVSAIGEAETSTFVDSTLVGSDAAEVVGKWIRVFTADRPAGIVTKVTAFDSQTGQLTLEDPLPAGAVKVNDVYHLADSRDLLLPSSVDPAAILKGGIGCTPAGTANADAISCVGIDATGVDAKAGDDTVEVTPPTIVLVTRFGSPEEATEQEQDVKSSGTSISLGDGNDQLVSDGVVVSAAIAVVSESPGAAVPGQDATKAAAKAEPRAAGIDGGDGQNVITNNGTMSTSATALLLARQIPGTSEQQKSADVSSTATATSSAIAAGDGGSFVTSTGRLTSRAIAAAAGVGLSASSKDPEPAQGNGTAAASADEQTPKEEAFTAKGDVKATATANGIALGSSADTVTNTDEMIVKGSAVSLAGGLAEIKAKGSAGASATSAATATAQGMSLGGGNDAVFNAGTLTVDATARSIAVEIAVADKNNAVPQGSEGGATAAAAAAADGQGQEQGEGEQPKAEPKPLVSTVDGSTTATASATGIEADGKESKPDSDPIFDFENGRVTLGRKSSATHTSGNDSVHNSGTITVTATASSTDSVVGVTVDGSATAKATSVASATALGVNLGGGNDSLTNSGSFTAMADATATAVSVTVAQRATDASTPSSGTPPSTGEGREASTASEATGQDESTPPSETPAPEPPKNTVAISTALDASASATATATGVTADGALSDTSDEWTAAAGGGQGFDLTRTEKTTQVSGADSVTNSGSMSVGATAVTRAASLGISVEGGAAAKIASTAAATALGIDLGGGNDTVTNTAAGVLTTTADATANALSVAVGVKTDPSVKDEVKSAAETGASAAAHATAISADGLVSDTTKTAALGIGGGSGLSVSYSTVTTVARGDDIVANDGAIVSDATATTRAAGLSVSVEGNATTKVTSTADAAASAIDLGGGNDTLTSTGSIAVTSEATANAIGFAVGIRTQQESSSPGGSAPPEAGATAADESTETPAETPSTPPALATPAKPAESATDASATAVASSVGVSGDATTGDESRLFQLQLGGGPSFLTYQSQTAYASGDDTVTNSGTISAGASATTRSEAVGGAIDGSAAVKVSSTATASAAGIDLGGGNDTLTNLAAGTLTVTSDATSNALAVSAGLIASQAGAGNARAATDASVTADASAIGISADALKPDVFIGGTISHLEGVLSLDIDISQTRASGNDTVSNEAAVTATATATAREAGLSLAIDGSASSRNSSTATAGAAAVDAGGGDDSVTNTGALTTLADATANALAVAVGVEASSGTTSSGDEAADAEETPMPTPARVQKKSAVDGNVTATANAAGVAADGLTGDMTIAGVGRLAVTAAELHIEFAKAHAAGDDAVTNSGPIDVTANATSRAVAVSGAVQGEAAVRMTATAGATAAGIDAGGGNDTVTSHGAILTTANAAAHGLDVAVAIGTSSGTSGSGTSAGDSTTTAPSRAKSSVDAGATAEARAIGIAADGAVSGTLYKGDLVVGNLGSNAPVLSLLKSETRATGDDIVVNTSDVEARATATTNAAAVGVTAEGSASTKVSSTADARATAIDLGGGADAVTTGGRLVAAADSTARALAASVTTKGTATSTEGGLGASEGLWKGGVEAQASAFGIDGMGRPSDSTSVDVRLGGTVGIEVIFEKRQDDVAVDEAAGEEIPIDGADTITSSGGITATAAATATALNVSLTGEGLAAAVTDIESEAKATAIRGGQGDDVINNLGVDLTTTVTASADSNAGTVAVSGKGVAVAADTLWTTGTKSEAAAYGLDGDGEAFKTKTITVGADSGGGELVIDKRESSGSGNDVIFNEQALTVLADASAPSLAVALEAARGLAATVSSVETEADAAGIRAGGGADTITNFGVVLVNADAFSVAANVAIAAEGVAAAGGSVWEGGMKADAKAVGIDADGGDTVIRTLTLAVDGDGATIERMQQVLAATGDDVIHNLAGVTVTASAETDSAAVAGTVNGLSAAFAASTANALAEAIRGGGGHDTIVNGGDLTATSTSIARALNVSAITTTGVAIAGNGVWDGGVTASAAAAGIRGDGGASETTKTITVHVGGGDLVNKQTVAPPASGADTIDNFGRIDANAEARTAVLSVSLALTGVGLAISTSTADATAAAIDAGDGDDVVTNQGALDATSTTVARTINGSGVGTGVAVSLADVWDGGVNATSTARGIDAGTGSDTVVNDGRVSAVADATTRTGTVAVAVTVVPVALSTSTATAVATAIDGGAGEGADTIENRKAANLSATPERDGALTAQATALATTGNAAVTTAGLAVAADAVWDAGTKAEAFARGIEVGGGADTVANDGNVFAFSLADTTSAAITVPVGGMGVAMATSTATALSTAIDAGDGDDIVGHVDPLSLPDNKLTARAAAYATTANISVVPTGFAVAADSVWEGGTSADASAAGIDTGRGADTVVNASEIEATSTSGTVSVVIPATIYGFAAALVTSSTTTSATAIKTGDDVRDVEGAPVDSDLASESDIVTNTGKLTADANTWAVSGGVGFTFGGVVGTADALWDGGTTGQAFSRGIGLGNGADTVTNSGAIGAMSNANAVSAQLDIIVFGVGAAVSTATAESRAWAIDGGDGDDTITNLAMGTLTTDAYATGVGVNVGLTAIGAVVASDTVWNGGTVADAIARGIGGGLGNDIITNDATITSTADADTASVSVTIEGIGLGGALATSTATATARAIDGGEGEDTIVNRADVTSTSVAEGRGIAVSLTGIGGGVSSDAVFSNGTTAAATATGLAAGAGNDTVWHLPGSAPADAAGLSDRSSSRKVTADATSHSQSTQVSVTLGGFAGVVAGSNSTARATAVDGGEGDDNLFVLSDVESTANATADGASVAVSVIGISAAGSLVDNAIRAESIATGIAGGDGADVIDLASGATATLTSTANTKDTAVSVTLLGLAAADTQAVATARAVGLDGGAGTDTLMNEGTITGMLMAESKARSVSVALNIASPGGATGNAEGGAHVFGTGLEGGEGDDIVTNKGAVSLAGTATARGNNVSVGGIGLSDADATSTASASLTGLSGGAGLDTVVNEGSVVATANAVADSTGTSVTLTVGSFADANTTASATAMGISGDEDADTIANAAGGTVSAKATAYTETNDNTVALMGAASGGARADPTGTAIGLDGGAGNDTIVNDGTLTAHAIGTSLSESSSFNLVGSSGTGAGITAQALATGMAGGADNDTLVNRGGVTATGLADATVDASSWTLAGVAGGRSTLGASGSATGMSGDAGLDDLVNLGDLTVTFEARLRAKGGSDAIFGGASADTQLTAHGAAFGLTGGVGDDTIRNLSNVDVLAKADVGVTRTEVSFAGSPDSSALVVARADSTGIAGGLGDDWIRNDGAIRVDVSSLSNVTGGASAKAFGSAGSSGVGTADGSGVGIQGDDGANAIVNARSIDVDAFGDSLVTSSARSGLLFGDGDTRADAKSTMSAFGIASGNGDSTVTNDGRLDVLSRATAYGLASASGATIDWSGDGTAVADAQASATSVGMTVLGGANTVVNRGAVTVKALATTVRAIRTTTDICTQEWVPTEVEVGTDEDGNPIFETRNVDVTTCHEEEREELDPTPTFAGGNGNGAAGDGTARSLGTATAVAIGFSAGNGSNALVNMGHLEVTASPESKTTSFADGDLGGDANATSRATANGLAIGLEAGHGANLIRNDGAMVVLANPLADASARATGGDICITFLFWTWCGSGGTGTGTASATFDAEAIGVQTGNGNNVIVNDGLLSVTAAPETSGAPAEVFDADVRHRSTSVTSRAVGIETGNGNNTVVNTAAGVIAVEARDLPLSYTCPGGTCSSQTTAVGILTGSGDDVVVNDGQLSAHTISTSGAATMGVAIDTGAGNDRVELGTGSQTTGAVLLGAGDDRFVWSSNAVLDGAVIPGDGIDTFALGGNGSDTFDLDGIGPFDAFELFAKEGESTWTLIGSRAMDWTVENGTLAVSGNILGTIETDAASAALSPAIVVNATGTITQADALPAIVIRDNGRLRNDGGIGATLGAGVLVTGQGGRVVNAGHIASGGVGVDLAGQGAVMDNSGEVTGLGAGAAVVLGGVGSVLRNEGHITGLGAGVQASGFGALVANSGQITAGGVALDLSGDGVSLDNSGAVSSLGQGAAIAVGGANSRLLNDGRVESQGLAIVADGLNPTLLNAGRITGASGAIWIDSASDSIASIVNEASGSILGGAGLGIRGGAGRERVTNAGLIAGGLDLGAGDDELRITGSSVIHGIAAGGAGMDTFILGGTTGVFDLSGLGSRLSGFEDLRVQGLAWTLEGVGASDWTIDLGTLSIAGHLTGTIATSPNAAGLQLRVLESAVLEQRNGGAAAWLRGGATLDNAGTVRSTGAGGSAVLVEGAANTFVNAGFVDASSGSDAVVLGGRNNAMANLGEIASSGPGGSAVVVDGTSNTLVNDGRIEASSGSDAVVVEGSGHTISNLGAIASTGDGVVLRGNGSVLRNLGSVSGGGGSAVVFKGHDGLLENFGAIVGGRVGVTVEGDGSVVRNLGSVSGGGDGSAVVLRGRSSLLENFASISGDGGGVTVGGDGSAVRNLSAITTGGSAVVFETSAGTSATLVNGPGALIESVRGVGVLGGDGSERVVNDGAIVSGAGTAVDLGAGDDELLLSTLARIGGTVLGGAGYDTLTLGGNGGLGLDLDTFGGFEMLRKHGPGTWLLAGSSGMDWDVTEGTVILDGALTGQGTLREGAWLAGNGTLGGFSNAGMVSPGMSLGAIHVAGDYAQTAGGTLQIEGAIVNGLSDRLIVDGRAALDGHLEIVPETRTFGIATEYVVLEAAGGVTGKFSSATSASASLDPFVEYGPGSVAVTVVRNDVSFLGMSDTANGRALGAALDGSKLAMARGDFKPLMDEFLTIDAGAQVAALGSLGGELHAWVPMSLLRTGEWFLSASAHRRISAQQQGERVRVWTDVARFGGDVNGDGNASGARFTASGLVGGMDLRLAGDLRLGASFGYSRGNTRVDAFSDDRGNARSLMPAVYGEYIAGPVRLEGAFGVGRHSIDTVRGVRVGAIARNAHAKYEADQYTGLARVGVVLPSPRPLLFEPFVEVRHSALTRQAFDEAGAESASLSVADEARVESLRSLVGVRASWAPKVFGVRVEPEVSVAWAHEALDRAGTLVGVLKGATARVGSPLFAVQSPVESRDGVVVSLGTSATFATHGRAFLSYDGARTETSSGHQLSAGVRFIW